jgi:20S proteasome alpha/beta subunit
MAVQKDLGRVGATTQMLNSYLQAPRQTPFWQQLVLAGIGGAGSVIQGFNK